MDIREPAILIRIDRGFRPGMSDVELYDTTRGPWEIDERRTRATHVLAVFGGIVKEVYEVAGWYPAGSTFSTKNPQGARREGRWEFVGRVADDSIRNRYKGYAVSHHFGADLLHDVHYLNL